MLVWLMFAFQDPPPPPGVQVVEAGTGFRSKTRLPNVPRTAAEPRGPPFFGRENMWMPFEAVLENTGPAVEGTLVLREKFALRGLVYRKRISLPSRSRKRIAFPVLHSVSHPFLMSLEDDRGNSIALGGANSVELGLPHTCSVGSTLVIVATESTGNFAHFLRPTREGAYSEERFVVPVAAADLPANAIEYHGVNTVVLDDIALTTLSSEQQDALLQFTARGGVLVACLLRNAHQVAGSALEPALPGLPGSAQNLTEVRALGKATAGACALDAPLAMTTFKPRSGATAWDAEAPVIVHRAHGHGTVVACGFPLSARFLETWPEASRFMDTIAVASSGSVVPMPGEYEASSLRKNLAVALKSSMIRKLPPFKQILGLMAGYGVAIVILPIALTYKFRRLEWSWVAVFLIALAGSGVVYGVGQRYIRGESVAHRVSLVEGGTAAGPHVRHNFWSVFTARGERLDLAFEEPSSVPFHFGRELSLRGTSGDAEVLTIGYDEVRLSGLKTYTQDSTLFETTDLQRLPASFRVFARAGDQRTPSIVIAGDPGFPLHRGWIVFGDQVTEVKSFGSGEEVYAHPSTTLTQAKARLAAEEDLLYRRVAEALLDEARMESNARRAPLFLYQYEGDPALKGDVLAERGFDFGWTEVEGWQAGENRPIWTWQMRAATPTKSPDPYQDLLTDKGVEYVLTLKVPEGFRPADLGLSRQSNPTYRIDLYNVSTQSWIAASNTHMSASAYTQTSPLGTSFVRVRFRIDPNRVRDRYWESPETWVTTFRVESTIERSP